MEEEKKSYWGNNLDNINDCENFIREAHWFLIAMAGFTCIFSFFVNQFFFLLPDMILMVVIALLLKKYQSCSIAIIMFLYSILISIITMGNRLHLPFAKNFGGGTNIFLAIIFVCIAFRTIQATYKLFKLRNYSISWKNFCIKSIIFIVLLLILEFCAIITYAFIENDMLLGSLTLIAIFLSMFIAYAGTFPMSNKLRIRYIKGVQDETSYCQDDEKKNIEDVHENNPLYNTIPIWKVIVLLILSFGVYTIPWAYNLWKQGQKKYDKKISPFWRSIFISFTSFKLFPLINDYLMNPPKKETENIDNNIINRYINDSEIKPFPATCFAWIYLMFSWVANALNKMGSYSQSFTIAELLALILNIIALIPIVIIQLKINATNYRYSIQAKNDTWTWKTTGFVALWFLLVFIVTIITAIISYT